MDVLLRGFLIVSLALNAGLALWLLRPLPERVLLKTGKIPQTRPGIAAATTKTTFSNSAGLSKPAFDWQQIESGDYRHYVANLRAIGCPEQTLRDIIAADLNQLYGERNRAIWRHRSLSREFWQKADAYVSPDDETIERLKTLEQEKQAMMQQILGARVPYGRQINVLFMQPDQTYSSLAFLSEDKRQAAFDALCEADLAYVSRGDITREEGQHARDAQLSLLSSILSPGELEEYRMRTDPTAMDLRVYLPYFECTPDEFKVLLKVREEMNSSTNAPADPYIRMAEEAGAFGKIFGEERGREYAEKTDLFYIWARKAAERYGLSEDDVDRAWVIKRDALATVQRLRVDQTLTPEERRQQVENLHKTAESKLIEVLGVKGTAIAKRGDWWLQSPTLGFGP